MTRNILIVGFIFLLTACGFSPMYGTHGDSNVPGGLDKVDIALIPDESGVFLRNDLIDSFYRNGYPSAPEYLLKVDKLDEQRYDLDITRNSETTRRQIKIIAKMSLRKKETGEVVLTRELVADTSYNVLGSQFTTRVSENDAREAALNDLARQIELQVGLYLKR